MLALDDYHSAIALGKSFLGDAPVDREDYPALVTELLSLFSAEAGRKVPQPSGTAERRRALKALLTIRPPEPLADAAWSKLDRMFRFERLERAHVDPAELPTLAEQFDACRYPFADRTVLWQGDISLLAADAITNAANNALLGCFQPFHACIDNVIHSCAGPRLRDDCATIMRLQGHPEETRQAKLTRAYHLPSRFVAHTVGPIVAGSRPTQRQQTQLADCYRSILDTCSHWGGIRSVAFCCISTGVFGYPQEQAAEVAIRTVQAWRRDNAESPVATVIFNVFRDDDLAIYRRLLRTY